MCTLATAALVPHSSTSQNGGTTDTLLTAPTQSGLPPAVQILTAGARGMRRQGAVLVEHGLQSSWNEAKGVLV